jgi:hypothetical protein
VPVFIYDCMYIYYGPPGRPGPLVFVRLHKCDAHESKLYKIVEYYLFIFILSTLGELEGAEPLVYEPFCWVLSASYLPVAVQNLVHSFSILLFTPCTIYFKTK